ncbi:MAG: hypothetical protein NZ888_06325 [Candidatus Nitrosocaldus sp.]|nr:hypothetical protein [Candidatus Nitrosocaldus sp.]MCS7141783.1 hypothetical protein [Candidatus Nitrosocaldus sp.]MDW8000459.1 hypothetical protein [Candidatus Nitrosocaldus sp.]
MSKSKSRYILSLFKELPVLDEDEDETTELPKLECLDILPRLEE